MAAPRAPQDRKAPAKRATRQRKPTTAEMATVEEADQTQGMRTEAAAEVDGYIEVEMGGYVYHLLPREEWRQSTQEALQTGRVNDWAEDVMPPKDFDMWLAADPTNREFGEFMEEMGRQVGASLGESKAARRYLRTMGMR